MRKVEYSQIVRQKMTELQLDLADRYGVDFSKRVIREITSTLRNFHDEIVRNSWKDR